MRTVRIIPLSQRLALQTFGVCISSESSHNSRGPGVLLVSERKVYNQHYPVPGFPQAFSALDVIHHQSSQSVCGPHHHCNPSWLSYTVKKLPCITTYCKNDIWGSGYPWPSDAEIAAWNKGRFLDTFVCTYPSLRMNHPCVGSREGFTADMVSR